MSKFQQGNVKLDSGKVIVFGDATEQSTAVSGIKNLGDVNNSMSPTDGQSLVWDDGNGYWDASTVSGGGGSSDHGTLTGLGDDDHTQYILADGTRAFTGDVTIQQDSATKFEIDTNNNGYVEIDAGSGQYAYLQLKENNSTNGQLYAYTNGATETVILENPPGTGKITLTSTVKITPTIELNSGTTVNEFSIDGTMAGNSDNAVPTEQAVKAYVDNNAGISDIVEDTTPQLGGDLDLNGNNIDFPTTANISDCLDEDDMSSDSATALATQQSIKAYVDSAGGSSDKIEEGNSSVEVVDAGTGYISNTVDGTEKGRWNTNGLLIGDSLSTANQTRNFVVQKQGANQATAAWVNCNSDGVNYANTFWFGRGRGTLASPSNTADGDRVANIAFNLYNNSSWRQPAHIRCKVDGTVSNGVYPTKLVIGTTATADTAKTDQLVIGPGKIIVPGTNSDVDFGSSSMEWDNIYCATLNESSDENKKENIQDSPFGLDYVMASRAVTYTSKDTVNSGICEVGEDENGEPIYEEYCDVVEHSRTHVGLVAQEQAKVIEGLGYTTKDCDIVTIGKNGEHSIRYTRLTTIAFKAIQEQQAMIDSQQKVIEDLTSRLEKLENDR